jgi:hypothetical protein
MLRIKPIGSSRASAKRFGLANAKLKRISITLFSAIFLSTFSFNAYGDYDLSFNNIPPGYVAYHFDENARVVGDWLDFSFLESKYPPWIDNARIVLPVCETDLEADCISSIKYISNSGSTHNGEFVSYLPFSFNLNFQGGTQVQSPFFETSERLSINGSQALKIPNGSRSSFWRFPELRHSDGDLYLVRVNFSGGSGGGVDGKLPLDWGGVQIDMKITPIKIDNDISSFSKNLGGDNIYWSKILNENGYLAMQGKWCGLKKKENVPLCYSTAYDPNFPKFRLDLKLNHLKDFGNSWVRARASDIKIENQTVGNQTHLFVEGKTIKVPRAVALLPISEEGFMLQQEAELIRTENIFGKSSIVLNNSGYKSWIREWETPGRIRSLVQARFPQWVAFDGKIPFYVRDEGISDWSFNSDIADMSTSSQLLLAKCPKGKNLGGVVTTNAAVYQPGPPTWDSETQSLEFIVASTHEKKDGSIAEGFYEVALRKDLAECFWGAEAISKKAVISVIDSRGSTKIVTSTYQVIGGYLYFKVQGFTYSVNKIAISFDGITKKKEVSESKSETKPQPEASPSAQPPSSQPIPVKTTLVTKAESTQNPKKITSVSWYCKKGATIKRLPSNKKCPNGFKKIAR